MEKVVSKRTVVHLMVIYLIMILNMIILGFTYNDLKENRRVEEPTTTAAAASTEAASTEAASAEETPQIETFQAIGDFELRILTNTLISQGVCLGALLILGPVFLLLADKGKLGYGEARSITLNVFLFAGLALSLGVGITVAYIAYRLQCTDVSRSLMMKLTTSAILSIFPVAFIIFLQLNDRIDKFGDMLTKETLKERVTQAAAEKLIVGAKIAQAEKGAQQAARDIAETTFKTFDKLQ